MFGKIYRLTNDNKHDRHSQGALIILIRAPWHNWLIFATAGQRLRHPGPYGMLYLTRCLWLDLVIANMIWQVSMFACVKQKDYSPTNDHIHNKHNQLSPRQQYNDWHGEITTSLDISMAALVWILLTLASFFVVESFHACGIVLFARLLYLCTYVHFTIYMYMYVHACRQILMFVYVHTAVYEFVL